MFISVIIPFYKGNMYINTIVKDIIDSRNYAAEHGNDVPIEIIIVNDSPNESVCLEEKYRLYYNIRIVTHEKNYGIHKARISGLNESRGDYIVFFDQDDRMLIEWIDTQTKSIKNADVCVGNFYNQNSNLELIPYYESFQDQKNACSLYTFLMRENHILSPGQCLIKRIAIPKEWQEYVLNDNGSDDFFLWILMLSQKKFFVFNKNHIYVHSYTGDNYSASYERMKKSNMAVYELLKCSGALNSYQLSCFRRSMHLENDELKRNRSIKQIICNIDIILFRFKFKIDKYIGRKYESRRYDGI